MALCELARATPTRDQVFYLDTSAVIPLALREGAARNGTIKLERLERERAEAVVAFVGRAQAAGAAIRTTVIAMEELAAKTRNVTRRDGLELAGVQRLGLLPAADADRINKQAQADMLEMMTFAAGALGALNIKFQRSAVADTETFTKAERLRKVHRELLRVYTRIDAMDALHIALGQELGAKAFVSFDSGWEDVAEIDVYR